MFEILTSSTFPSKQWVVFGPYCPPRKAPLALMAAEKSTMLTEAPLMYAW